MKVIFLASDLSYPPHGGRAQRTFHTLRQVARRAEVHFFAFDQGFLGGPTEDRDRAHDELRRMCASVTSMPLAVKKRSSAVASAVARSLLTLQPYSAVIYRSTAMTTALREAVGRVEPNVFHCDSTDLCEYGRVAPRCARILVHHNVESDLMRQRALADKYLPRRAFMQLEARKLLSLERRMGAYFHRHVAVSQSDRVRLSGRVGGESIAVVPNGVDTEYFHPLDEIQDPDTLVHVGGLNWYPNVDGVRYFLREVWWRIRRARPGARFRLVGPRPPTDIERLSGREGVEVHGYVPDVRPIIARSAVYVVPLRIGGGTRLKILDAMAMGSAVVSTSIGCDGLDVCAGEDLLVADTPGDLADRILGLLADQGERRRLGAHARAKVQRLYSWERVGEALDRAYQEAIQRASAQVSSR